jgi:hypothetical protein
LNQKENYVGERKSDRSNGIVPLRLSSLTEQKPISYVQNGKNDVEAKATDAPVCLRISSFGACEHNVKYEEGQKDAEHSNKFQQRSGSYVAVLLLFCSLDQRGKHHTDAKEITDVGEVNVEIPTDRFNVVKDSKACNNTNKSESAIDGLENELCGSVFNHDYSPYIVNLAKNNF